MTVSDAAEDLVSAERREGELWLMNASQAIPVILVTASLQSGYLLQPSEH